MKNLPLCDDDRVLGSLRKNGSGRAQDIRSDYKSMSIAQINCALHRLELVGDVKQTSRGRHIYWEAAPCSRS